ncbi:MAG: hemerythrin domain-containing protein, partial [Patescibacteria group bacterium]
MKGLSKKQEKFKWNSDYSVNVKEIDDQHKVILEFINSLNDKVFNGVAESFIGKNLREMEEYVERHFVMEEKYFTQFNYAGAEDHI